jgi:hypothetical protein
VLCWAETFLLRMHDAARLHSPAKPEWMARNIRLLGRQFKPGRQVRVAAGA